MVRAVESRRERRCGRTRTAAPERGRGDLCVYCALLYENNSVSPLSPCALATSASPARSPRVATSSQFTLSTLSRHRSADLISSLAPPSVTHSSLSLSPPRPGRPSLTHTQSTHAPPARCRGLHTAAAPSSTFSSHLPERRATAATPTPTAAAHTAASRVVARIRLLGGRVAYRLIYR